MLGNPYFLLTGSLGVQFFNSFFFLPTQWSRPPLITYSSLCSTCMSYRTTCHPTGHQVLPTQPVPREAEDFRRGGMHSKHMSLLTCLAWQQLVTNNLRLIFKYAKTKNILLVVKNLIKKYKVVAPLILKCIFFEEAIFNKYFR